MSAPRSRQRSAAPCALQKASVVARKDGIARSWLCGRTISAVRGSSCDRKQQGLSCRRSGLGTTSNARRRGRYVGRQGACAGRGCAGGRVGWAGLLRGAHTHARRGTARFASHAVTTRGKRWCSLASGRGAPPPLASKHPAPTCFACGDLPRAPWPPARLVEDRDRGRTLPAAARERSVVNLTSTTLSARASAPPLGRMRTHLCLCGVDALSTRSSDTQASH